MDTNDQHHHGFKFEKTVSITHVISTLMIGLSGVWWGASVESRLLVDSTKIDTVKQDTARLQNEARDSRIEVREQLRNINDKLDRLVERGVSNNAVSQKSSAY